VTVDWRDGTVDHLTPGPDHTFALNHTYTTEGSFFVSVVVTDNQGQASVPFVFLIHSFVEPPSSGSRATATGGNEATASVPGLTVTLERDPDAKAPGSIVIAGLPLGAVVTTPVVLKGVAADRQTVAAFDIRGINLTTGDRAKVVFEVSTPNGAEPEIRFLDPDTGQLVPVQGSQLIQPAADAFRIDRIGTTNRFQVTLWLDNTSVPRLIQTTRTIFTLSVPVQPVSQTFTSPTQLVLVTPANGGGGFATATNTFSFERTDLSAGSQRSLTFAAAQTAPLDLGSGGGPDTSPRAMADQIMTGAAVGFWESPRPGDVPALPDLPEEEEEQTWSEAVDAVFGAAPPAADFLAPEPPAAWAPAPADLPAAAAEAADGDSPMTLGGLAPLWLLGGALGGAAEAAGRARGRGSRCALRLTTAESRE
jgi:hypothetical protein